MACRTTGYVGYRSQFVFLYQVKSERKLISVFLAINLYRFAPRRFLITHIEDLISVPQIFFRSTMAVQAPLHLQRRGVVHQRHPVHRPMTGIAAHTFVDMNAVIEIGKVGQIVHPGPNQRLTTAIAFPDWFQQWRIRPNLSVTVHAGLGRRDPGKAGSFNRSMTVEAINSLAGNVVLVTERHRLRPAHTSIGHIG